MIFALYLMAAACVNVHSDRLTAGDLAAVVPEFAALAPGQNLGFAPVPGATRNLTERDVQRLATQAGISISSPSAACLEWKMRPLQRSDLSAAIRTALNQPDAKVEIHEFSLYPVPEGKIEFPLKGLTRPATGPALWRGYVNYSGSHRFDIWAKVTLTTSSGSSQVLDVQAGELVHVLVEGGPAQLKLDARAESSGLVGESVTVRNPHGGKTFHAEITGRNSVRVRTEEEVAK